MSTEKLSETSLYLSDPRSKSVEGMIIGLNILAKYMKDGLRQKWCCQAEHDIITFNVEEDKLAEDTADGRALIALGFHLSSDLECWAYFT